MISPPMVMTTVEKKKLMTPAITDSESRVKRTLTPTLPHRMVVNRKLESSLKRSIFWAFILFFLDSISRRSLLRLKNARLRPENVADCEMHINIPIQTNVSIIISLLTVVSYTPLADASVAVKFWYYFKTYLVIWSCKNYKLRV